MGIQVFIRNGKRVVAVVRAGQAGAACIAERILREAKTSSVGEEFASGPKAA